MNYKINKEQFVAFVAICGFAVMSAVANINNQPRRSFLGYAPSDSVSNLHKMLPGETLPDTTPFKGKPYEGSEIVFTARAYGDSIVLRWAPSDYAAWMRLNRVGYNIYRYDERMHCDTLALALKPKTLDEFRAKYPLTDSVATVGYGLIYGDNMKHSSDTREEPGSFGAMLEMYDDQVTSLAFAVLASEWRQDLAEDMAMRFVDVNVRKGMSYKYIIQPAFRLGDDMVVKGKELSDVVNMPYVRMPYKVGLRDSVTAPLSVTLSWTDHVNSSFDVERRLAGTQEWCKVNQKPYMPMFKQDIESAVEDVMFVDNVPDVGTYEYRVMAHDAFGDTTLPSEPLLVKVGDQNPPSGPVVTMVNIDRPDESNPTKQIFATIMWKKDTIESDLAGYMPLYYNERFTGNDWKPLCEAILPVDCNQVTVDVTGLSTGMLVVASYDKSGNVGYSLPVQLRISDMKAPDAPSNLRAEVSSDDGTITLRWNKPHDDDVAYYELAYANDSTHHFLMRNQGQLRDTMFVDSVQMTVNQRYIYYKVRAIDYSNNIGDYSPILQVERPHITPPTQAHLDTAWVDNSGIHMDWVTGLDADMYYHRIYRRLENRKSWDLIAIVTAEDVLRADPDGVIHLTDKPQSNNSFYYEYMVVSFNRSEIASEPSLVFSARFADFSEADLGIKLLGRYDANDDEARLAWSHATIDNQVTPYYYCVYRKAKGDAGFSFLCSTEPDTPMHTDELLAQGESASYYVIVRFVDGRRSKPSNIVTIVASEKTATKF